MKFRSLFIAVLVAISFSACCAAGQGSDSSSLRPFLGRWDITITTPTGKAPSWLNLYQKDGVLRATMTGRWGNARPIAKVSISNGELTLVDPKEEEASKTDLIFKATIKDGKLVGSATGTDGAAWTWAAVRAPSLARTGTPHWGTPITLFDGKDLNGWRQFKSGYFTQEGDWTVVNGELVSPGGGPELVTDKKFEDFKLHVEFKNGPVSNSGVYLRGRYELQIENESADEPPSHHTGGVYGFITPNPEPPRETDKWRSYDITLIGRRVTVVLDGIKIIDNKEIPGLTGGAFDSNEGEPGPIYLQGSEKGHVYFRNITITPAE